MGMGQPGTMAHFVNQRGKTHPALFKRTGSRFVPIPPVTVIVKGRVSGEFVAWRIHQRQKIRVGIIDRQQFECRKVRVDRSDEIQVGNVFELFHCQHGLSQFVIGPARRGHAVNDSTRRGEIYINRCR